MCIPSGENATEKTEPMCPSNGPDTTWPVWASQTLIALSEEPETMCFPSGENATETMCSSNGPDTTWPVWASQTLIVLSEEPETMCFPSGENATEKTEPMCPSN